MQMQEMKITIGTDGRVHIYVKRAPGANCVDLTAALKQQVGAVEERTFTSEFYEEPVTDRSEIRPKKN